MSARINNEKFVSRSREIHGDRYCYDKVEIISATAKVIIICDIHGEFYQQANIHYRGVGCPECSGNKKVTAQELKEQLRKIHENRYVYLFDAYKNSKEKVKIVCEHHGEFSQVIAEHKSGKGCSSCAAEKRGLDFRFKRSRSPYQYRTICVGRANAGLVWDLERELHKKLKLSRYKPNLFFDGHTECFSNISSDVIQMITDL